MQMQMPEMPHRILSAILMIVIVHMLATAGGGWMLYQAALSEMDATVADAVQRLEDKIDANGGRIDRNADLIMHNGELIAQLRERTAAVEVRVGGLEEVVRFFHPPESELPRNP